MVNAATHTENTKSDTADNVAKPDANAQLDHSADGLTTRTDQLDLGVPMLPGRPDEPTGPEDALGVGPKRGDYTGRVGPENYQPHESKRVVDAKPGEAHTVIEAQRPRTDEIADAQGKGGTNPQ